MTIRTAVAAFILVSGCTFARANDKKDAKEMIVIAGRSARQVNTRPLSHTPAHADTTCSGTVSAHTTDLGGMSSTNGTTSDNCTTTYTPEKTDNWVTVDNASWVTDVATGDQYLIQCTANWVASKCTYLIDGAKLKAVLKGNNMWITGMKGMKEMTAKYHVLQYMPNANHVADTAVVSNVSSSRLTGEEQFTWKWYNTLSEIDKKYVSEFCPANPTGKALLPRVKVDAGEPAERALYCQPWLSAKAKQ